MLAKTNLNPILNTIMYDSKYVWEFLKQALLSNKVISEFN